MYSVIFSHPDFVVLSKPSAVNFHSEEGQAGFVEQAKQQLGEPLWPVHRLDKLTSGLLILARSAEAAAQFQELFSQRQIEKYYLALAKGKPSKKQGLIKGDMAKGRNGSWLLKRSSDNPAITRFLSYSLEPGLRVYLLKPATGKTHQLRVAMKSLGVPILGDRRYAGEAAERGYLHAYGLRFSWKLQSIQLCSANELSFNPALAEFIQQHSKPWLEFK